jgi:hypothetical protein
MWPVSPPSSEAVETEAYEANDAKADYANEAIVDNAANKAIAADTTITKLKSDATINHDVAEGCD